MFLTDWRRWLNQLSWSAEQNRRPVRGRARLPRRKPFRLACE
jgi:hypothetical protein